MKQLLRSAAASTVLLGLAASPVVGQPTLRQRWPAANAAAAQSREVGVAFEPAPGLVLRLAPLWVYSAQRGGQRVGHSGQLDRTGNRLVFRPAYAFKPGEVVYATTWAAPGASQAPRPLLWQFTAAVGGTGEGSFEPGTDLPAPALAPGLALGDVDGDGDLDLLTASTSTSQVRVRLNQGGAASPGTGPYDAGTLVEMGHPTYSIAVGDVDGDGDLDLVAGGDNGGTVSVRLNGGDASGAGTGHFSGGSTIALGGTSPTEIALGDVDGDGDLDLLATNNCGAGSVRVCLNGGAASGRRAGVFRLAGQVAVGSNPFGLALGDVDGDGDLDLLTANLGGTVSVRLNGGDAAGAGTGTFGAGREVPVGAEAVGLALGDIDNDGDLDLLTANFLAGTVSVRLNGGDATGSNTGAFSGGAEVPVGRRPQRVALADVDHDGDLDMLAACTGAGAVSVRLNGGNAGAGGTGRFGGGTDPAAGTAPVGLALGDVDGDGDLDLLTTSPAAGQLSLRLNQPRPASADDWPAAPTPSPTALLLEAYPNPGAQAQQLRISTSEAGLATLWLADALGRCVQRQQVQLAPGATSLPVAAAGLAPGVYMLRVQQGSQQQSIRLVRQ